MNERRKKLKINVFDVFIIILVLCLIGTLVYRVYNNVRNDSNKSKTSYVVYFECDGEYNSIEKYLNDGDALYFESSGELLGYLTKWDPDELILIETDAATLPEVTEEITENITETVTEKATEIITEKTTEKITEEITEDNTEELTEGTTEENTEEMSVGETAEDTENDLPSTEGFQAAAYGVILLSEEDTSDVVPNYGDISFKGKLRLNGDAEKSNVGDYFTVGQEKITVGSKIAVYTDRAQFTITVTEIKAN